MILVTGGTGFVGRRLMSLLVATYGAENLTCLVRDQWDNDLERSGRKILEQLGVSHVPVDLVSGLGLDGIPQSPDMVFHLASNTDTGSPDHTINDRGTRNLVQALGPLPPGFHFIFTSTIAVSDHRADASKPADETTELLRPFNDYGRRKLAAERYLREQAAARSFQVTIIRLSPVYGGGTRRAGLYDMFSHLVARDVFLARLNYPGTISLIGVNDIAQVIVAASRRHMPAGTTDLFIPAAEVVTIQDLLCRYYQAHGKLYRPINLPKIFWQTCNLVARIMYRLEPLLPHVINNRFWQASMLVGNGLATASNKTQRTFPNLRMGKIMEAIGATGPYNGLEKS